MSGADVTPTGTPEPAKAQAGWIGPFALFTYGSVVVFWLWAKWLFAPQIFFLPPLPPVEVLITLVESTLGPWIVALVTLSCLALIALDAFKSRAAPRHGWWWKSLLRGSAETVGIHAAVWGAGTILFTAIMALLPGSEVRTISPGDPVVRGLVLFTTFLSLLMSGPITALVIAARSLARRRRDGFPESFFAALNHSVAILLVPLATLWVLSGYPRATLQAFERPDARENAADLLLAAREGDASQVRSLVARGAPLNGQDRSGTTPLMAAAANGHPEAVQALIASGADVNLKDASGRTALMAAAANREAEIAAELIAAKADVQRRDAEGKTALTLAAIAGEAGIVRALLRAGAEVNAAPPSGDTALMISSRRGDLETVRALIESGADLNARNREGETAVELARRFKRAEIIALLEVKSAARP